MKAYTEQELRGKLSQYANNKIEVIACDESGISVLFKAGWSSNGVSALHVDTIKAMKAACTKSALVYECAYEQMTLDLEITEKDSQPVEVQEVEKIGMTQEELENTLKELDTVRRLRKELEEREKAIQEKLLEDMTAKNTDKLEAAGFVATSKTVKSTRFDTKAFKSAHADLYESFLIRGYQTRFNFR